MKKLLEKDKKNRKSIRNFEKKKLLLKVIQANLGLPYLIRLNATKDLNNMPKKLSRTLISNRCIATIHKKKFNKLTRYSRIFFLRLAKSSKICGLNKASW